MRACFLPLSNHCFLPLSNHVFPLPRSLAWSRQRRKTPFHLDRRSRSLFLYCLGSVSQVNMPQNIWTNPKQTQLSYTSTQSSSSKIHSTLTEDPEACSYIVVICQSGKDAKHTTIRLTNPKQAQTDIEGHIQRPQVPPCIQCPKRSSHPTPFTPTSEYYQACVSVCGVCLCVEPEKVSSREIPSSNDQIKLQVTIWKIFFRIYLSFRKI